MEKIIVHYKISGESDNYPNAFELSVRRGKEVYLADVMNAMKSSNHSLGINFSFYSNFENKIINLYSPSCIVPVEDGIISIVMTPSSFPPMVPINQLSKYYRNSGKDFQNSAPSNSYRNSNDEPGQIDISDSNGFTEDKKKHDGSATANEKFREETVTVITEVAGNAAAVAKEAAGDAARSLLNFAALSVKTVTHAAASFSGQIQVTIK